MQCTRLGFLIGFTALLAACGGGGGGNVSALPPVSAQNPAGGTPVPTPASSVNASPTPTPRSSGAASPTPTPTPTPTPASLSVAQYAVANSVRGITLGPDGNVWLTDAASNVDRLNPVTGAAATFGGMTANESTCTVPSAPPNQAASGPVALGLIVAGPGGNLWYSVACGGALQYGYGGFNQMSTSGAIVQSAAAYYNPPFIQGATVGSDGNVWAAEADINGNYANEYVSPSGTREVCSQPQSGFPLPSVTTGPDGALWFASNNGSGGVLARAVPACANLTVTTVATAAGTTFDARSIASAGGALWVIDAGKNQIDKFTTTGALASYAVPKSWTRDAQGAVGFIAASATYVYFDDSASGQIGRIAVATGAVQEYSLPSGLQPQALAVDANGNVWTYSGATVLKITFPT